MKILLKSQALHAEKPEGLSVDYYLFPEYEIHVNHQAPHTTQVWHHHEKIWETIVVLGGTLIAMWEESGQELKQTVSEGDVIETQHTPHCFINDTDQIAAFLVIKQVLSGENKSELLKTDKILD